LITEKDLKQAIAECQGERNPNANTCIKLAAFYTIKNELYGKPDKPELIGYSTKPPQAETSQQIVDIDSDSEFAQAANGKPITAVLDVMIEIVDTLYYTNKPLYKAIIRRLNE
jgi:hypothetical protein